MIPSFPDACTYGRLFDRYRWTPSEFDVFPIYVRAFILRCLEDSP